MLNYCFRLHSDIVAGIWLSQKIIYDVVLFFSYSCGAPLSRPSARKRPTSPNRLMMRLKRWLTHPSLLHPNYNTPTDRPAPPNHCAHHRPPQSEYRDTYSTCVYTSVKYSRCLNMHIFVLISFVCILVTLLHINGYNTFNTFITSTFHLCFGDFIACFVCFFALFLFW